MRKEKLGHYKEFAANLRQERNKMSSFYSIKRISVMDGRVKAMFGQENE
ncbi:MAG: hypothetical protein ABIV21_09455 [Pyrinomonadaceae bacterium]